MNYEKAYKSVLQTATQWIKDGCTDKEKICLESVFPELRESEDEKIINNLRTCLHCGKTHGMVNDDEYLVCKNYLEKQKEQKRIECICIDFDNEFENQISHLIASVITGKIDAYKVLIAKLNS